MDLSACIVNFNTRDHLRRCLLALAPELASLAAEVLVVDNASADSSADLVRREFPSVTLIANADNRFYAAANNQALAQARGDSLLLLNPDVELLPGALSALLCVLRADPRAAAAAPQLILPDGSIQDSCRAFLTPALLLYETLGLSRLFPRSRRFGAYRLSWWAYDDFREVDQPMASCLLLRRAALDQVGVFDESFPMFFNDVDLCYRLRQAGWRLFFAPQARARHHHGASTRQVWPEMVRQSNLGLRRFYRKHYRGRLSWPAYALGMLLIYVGGWVRQGLSRLRRTPGSRS